MTQDQLDTIGRIIGYLEDYTMVRQVHANGRSVSEPGPAKTYHEKEHDDLTKRIEQLHDRLRNEFGIRV